MDILAKRLMKIAKMISASEYEYSSSGDAAKEALDELNDLISKSEKRIDGKNLRIIDGLFGAINSTSAKIEDDVKFNECAEKISHGISRNNAGEILNAVKYIRGLTERMYDEFWKDDVYEFISRHYLEKKIDDWSGLLLDIVRVAEEAERDIENYIDSSFYRVEINYNGQTPSEFFEVEADDEVTALEMAVALCEKNGLFGLLESPEDFDELDEDEQEDYIYVDGSSFGTSHPWYVRSDLVDIREM